MISLDIKCPEQKEVLSSSTLELLPGGENILETCNNDHWRAPAGKSGEEAQIIVDLKCPMRLEAFSIINGFGDFGTEKFAMFGSRNSSGPWTELYRGELPHGVEMTDEVKFIIIIIIDSRDALIFQDIHCCEKDDKVETTTTTMGADTETTKRPESVQSESTERQISSSTLASTSTTATKNQPVNLFSIIFFKFIYLRHAHLVSKNLG